MHGKFFLERLSRGKILYIVPFLAVGGVLMACGLLSSVTEVAAYPTLAKKTVEVIQMTSTPSQTSEPARFTKVTNVAKPLSISPTLSSTPTITPTFTATATILPLVCLPEDGEEQFGLVKWVSSGDTIVVDIQGALRSIHYIGVRAPRDLPDVEYYGPPASTQNAAWVADQVVRLVSDGSDLDQMGRLRRYVIIYESEMFVNFELIRSGLARPEDQTSAFACAQSFGRAEEIARELKLGMWAASPTLLPSFTPRPTIAPNLTPSFTLTPSLTPTPSLSPTITPTPTVSRTPVPPTLTRTFTPTATFGAICDPSYEPLCIPPPPPDLDCADITFRNFPMKEDVWDPHGFDTNLDHFGCGPGDEGV
jgi:micrococcal nuclease